MRVVLESEKLLVLLTQSGVLTVKIEKRKRERRACIWVLLAIWTVWISYCAHYRWSSRFESVYPLIAPIVVDGSDVEFSLENMPADIYEIFPAIAVPDKSNKHEFQEHVKRAIDARPIDIRAVVTDHRGKEIFRIDKDSKSWVAGSLHTYLGADGPEFVVLFDPGEIMSFHARGWSTYRLRIAIKAEKSSVADQPMQIVIKGDRDDGKVYPVKYILGLSASFLFLFVVSVIIVARRSDTTDA